MLLVALAFSVPGVANAAPTVTFKAEFVPIPGFPGTGNYYGAGAAVRVEYQIEGTEYGGFPPPLVAVNLYLAKRTFVHTAGFPSCAGSILESVGPSGCKKSSTAGPIGNVLGIVSFGSERVEESATLQSFYSPEGGLEFFTEGHSPVSLEILSAGHYVNLGGAGGYGPELITQVPLVSTVPDAPYTSLESIAFTAGSAYRKEMSKTYYDRVPTRCPKGGFPIRDRSDLRHGRGQPACRRTRDGDLQGAVPEARSWRNRRRSRKPASSSADLDPGDRRGDHRPVQRQMCQPP